MEQELDGENNRLNPSGHEEGKHLWALYKHQQRGLPQHDNRHLLQACNASSIYYHFFFNASRTLINIKFTTHNQLEKMYNFSKDSIITGIEIFQFNNNSIENIYDIVITTPKWVYYRDELDLKHSDYDFDSWQNVINNKK